MLSLFFSSPAPSLSSPRQRQVLYCTVLCCNQIQFSELYCNVVYFTMLYCYEMDCTGLYCIVLFCSAHCSRLQAPDTAESCVLSPRICSWAGCFCAHM